MITQERLKELFEYDEATGRLRRVKKPRLDGRGRVQLNSYPTSVNTNGYLIIMIDNRRYLVHRLVYLYHFGEFPKLLDHINMDKLDNRIANLREATSSQNACNTKKRKTNTSGTKGVSYDVTSKTWKARIMVDYKVVAHKTFKGSRDDEAIKQEAIDWITNQRQEHHMEFSNNR